MGSRNTLEIQPFHAGAVRPRLALAVQRVEPGLPPDAQPCATHAGVFHASCRPHSWSLFGVHLQLGTMRGLGARSVHVAPGLVPPGMRGEEAAAAGLVEAARLLAPELGGGRVWLWCAGRLPSRRFVTLLAGCATLREVARARLGLEVSERAFVLAGDDAQRRVDELRNIGLGVALRLSTRGQGPSSAAAAFLPGLARARALGLSAIAADVVRRDCAPQLGEAGFAAVSGPAVGRPTSLDELARMLGPAEPWLVKMRADSV